MTKRMLVDATHPEETRVAIVDGNWLSDFDFERASRQQLKGNIYLAKVIRIEPSLQAAFVEYGGNRHGFLPFTEIHPDYFRIPMADRPHDEEAPEDHAEDATDDHPEDNAAENAAYTEQAEVPSLEDYVADHHDHDHDHHDIQDHHHEHGGIEAGQENLETPALQADAQELPQYTETPVAPSAYAEMAPAHTEFAGDVPVDLGLITDFGNAAIVDPNLPPPPVTLETVGGEVIEEERIRRQPRPRYKIQEVIKRRQVMLIQVVKEERGNKGAALTTFLSLAGRYCVLMPNTDHGGGVSRKITSHQDRRRMKEILDQLEIPEGMAVILRTAGMEQEPAEIQRDLEYLLRMWNNIREQTLQSTAPALIYEEANLIKRSMRDMYAPDLGEILVAGARGYQLAIEFMRNTMPDQLDKVKLYEDVVPLFFRYNVEKQIDQLYNPTVQLRSGGYIVINPTEALVSIDVNSGRATRERHIEGTALKTNLEAAEEIARQLRLRDLAGLVVIDFIDMEDGRNNAAVERRVKDAMRVDRARLQIGRISPFGLLELSRQRLHPSLMEINFEKCPHCSGLGLIRSIDSAAISILRMIEEEGIRQGAVELVLHLPSKVALYILNQKRNAISEIESRYNLQVLLHSDDELVPPDFRLERIKASGEREIAPVVNGDIVQSQGERPMPPPYATFNNDAPAEGGRGENQGEGGGRRGGRGRYGSRNRNNNRNNNPNQNPNQNQQPHAPRPQAAQESNGNETPIEASQDDSVGNVDGAHTGTHHVGADAPGQEQRPGRRRGRRGGRGRRNNNGAGGGNNNGERPPRNPNQQQQPGEQRQGNWNRSHNHNAAAAPIAYEPSAAPHIPTSIHDIDTTPRAPSTSPQRAPSQAASSTPYEIVDQAGDKPKGGWWRNLTGQ
jgi:ribonuclease E